MSEVTDRNQSFREPGDVFKLVVFRPGWFKSFDVAFS